VAGAGVAAATAPASATGNRAFLDTSASDLGLEFSLQQNQPNPFRSSALVRFSLPSRRDVRLEVFDVGGRRVKTLARGSYPPGLHTLPWNGTSDSGTRLKSGIYLYRLVAGRDVATRKLILID